MSSGPKTQTTTQTASLPPQYQAAMNSVLQQANALSPQPVYESRQVPGQWTGYGYSAPTTIQVPTGETTGGVESIVPELSQPTLQGLDMLTAGPNQSALNQFTKTAQGGYLNANPFTSAVNPGRMSSTGGATQSGVNPVIGDRSSIQGVSDAISQQATKAVADRFAQAGRGGSGAEGMTLAGEVTRQLAPFAFAANESGLGRDFAGQEAALGRGFAGQESNKARGLTAQEAFANRQYQSGENAAMRGNQFFNAERNRQLMAAPQLNAMNQQNIQNQLLAGQITEEQARQQMLEPFNLFNLRTDPLIRAIGGAPLSQTTTQPVNRNVGAGVLGGAATGAGIGSALALSNPWTAGLAIGGGLLGGLF